MQLIYHPDPRLRKVCKEAPKQSEKERARIAGKMWRIMKKNNGVGLAASQVGLDIRMFIFLNEGSNDAIWNPILNSLGGSQESVEGCLSLPKVSVTMQRATRSVLTGYGVDGQPSIYCVGPELTRIFQHEIDHLDGKLIIDNMSREETLSKRDALKILSKTTKDG